MVINEKLVEKSSIHLTVNFLQFYQTRSKIVLKVRIDRLSFLLMTLKSYEFTFKKIKMISLFFILFQINYFKLI